jgi:pyrimidine-nucleoside phosphorylase
MEADEIGSACLLLGGGRETKESAIDLSVGIVLRKKTGDAVKKGDTLAVLHANDRERLEAAKKRFLGALQFSETAPQRKPLIRGIVTAHNEGTAHI